MNRINKTNDNRMELRPTSLKKRHSRADLLPNEQEIAAFERFQQFWAKNKAGILALVAVLILAIVGVVAWRYQEAKVLQEASVRLSAAHSAAELQAVAQEFLGTDPGLIAAMSLADLYFQQKDWEKAVVVYRSVIDHYPSSLLVASARIGLAATNEATGKKKEALEEYMMVASNFPNAFQAPQAQFAAARLQEESGQWQEARKIYEELVVKYPKSAWRGEAEAKLQKINLQIKSPA